MESPSLSVPSMTPLLLPVTATERRWPLVICSVTGLFHGTRPLRRPTSCTWVGPTTVVPAEVVVTGELLELRCTAATTTPATPIAPAAHAATTAPRESGRGKRIRVTTLSTSGTIPHCAVRSRRATPLVETDVYDPR